jgi:DNA-binding NtrC family response regulator
VLENTSKSSKLLVVSSDPRVLGIIVSVASANRWLAEIATEAEGSFDKMHAASDVELLVLDLPKHPSDGLEIIRNLRRLRSTLAAVVIGYPGDFERRQEAIQLGVRDYLVRPLEDRELELAIRRNLRVAASAQPIEGICGYKSLRSLLQSVKEEAEKNAISLALEQTGWNRKAAARLLKTSYRSVLYKIEQYQMSSPDRAAMPDRTQGAITDVSDGMKAGKPTLEFQRLASGGFDE